MDEGRGGMESSQVKLQLFKNQKSRRLGRVGAPTIGVCRQVPGFVRRATASELDVMSLAFESFGVATRPTHLPPRLMGHKDLPDEIWEESLLQADFWTIVRFSQVRAPRSSWLRVDDAHAGIGRPPSVFVG